MVCLNKFRSCDWNRVERGMEDCLKLVKEYFPEIDADIEDYVSAVLESTCEELEALDDVYDAIGEVLHGVDPAKTEEEVRELCARLCFTLKPGWTEKATSEPPEVQRVFATNDYGDQRPDVVTTTQNAELETLDNTSQDNQANMESEISLQMTKAANKGGKIVKKKKGKGGKVDAKNKNKYGSSEVNLRSTSKDYIWLTIIR